MPFADIEDAIAAIGAGEMVIVVDDADRENEGDLIMAAEYATADKIAFFLNHTSGVICIPLTGDRLDALDLPPMVSENTESQRTAFTVSVDYRHGTTTGISAGDRAASSSEAVTPRPASTWPAWPASTRRACSARSSARTRPAWPGCPSWSASPRSTACC